MATSTRVQMIGLRQLGESIRQLADDMQQKLARSATGRAAKVVKTAVAAKAGQQPTLADKPFTHEGVTYQPGHVARNVVAKRVRQPEATSEYVVAVRSNKKNGYAGKIAALNEFGTVNMPAQPFMGPAFEVSKQDATTTLVDTLRKGIENAAKKARKQ